jgi:choloylglycine hydrolase
VCTAISFNVKDHYFGRNLDLYYNYNEQVVITPRKFPFKFKLEGENTSHFAFIGMATVEQNFPLYYDGANEKGLSVAALNFPDNAFYGDEITGKINLAPFEFIPYLLSNFGSVDEALPTIKNMNFVDLKFSDALPNTPLHFIISDKHRSLAVEPMKDGLKIYDNPIGVLTNNPPFDLQMLLLQNYSALSVKNPENHFWNGVKAKLYSLGMGAMGLPGDLSSPSRFARVAFTKLNSVCTADENTAVGQFFHILGSVEQVKGLNKVEENQYEYTIYSSCINTDKGVYYYITYNNRSITAVNMKSEDLNSKNLIIFDLLKDENITNQN